MSWATRATGNSLILGRDGLRLRQGFGGQVRAVPLFSLLSGPNELEGRRLRRPRYRKQAHRAIYRSF